MFADQFAPGGEISLHNNHKSRSYSYHVPESEDRRVELTEYLTMLTIPDDDSAKTTKIFSDEILSCSPLCFTSLLFINLPGSEISTLPRRSS